MSIFDDLLKANKKKKSDNGNRNTTGNTVQQQAQQQVKKVENKKIERPQQKSATQSRYQQILDSYKERNGIDKNQSVSRNISEGMFGKTSLLNAAANVVTGNKKDNLKPYTAEQEAQARRLAQQAKEKLARDAQTDTDTMLALSVFGNKYDNDDAYMDYLPKVYDDNPLVRTYNDVRAGFLGFYKGNEGNALASADSMKGQPIKDQTVGDALADVQYTDELMKNVFGRTPQSLYDRFVMGGTRNAVQNAQTSALVAASPFAMGSTAAEMIGRANLGHNSFGDTYADVRLGNEGEQYANDIDAARRYALGNAASEVGQEFIPGGYVGGADIPGISNMAGEFVQEGAGAAVEPYLRTLLDFNPLTQTKEWAQALADTRRGLVYDENGNYDPRQYLTDVANAGGEGAVQSLFGEVTHPVQTMRQIGSDINSIRTQGEGKRLSESFENAAADLETAKKMGNSPISVDEAQTAADSIRKDTFNYLRNTNALRSTVESIKKNAQKLNRMSIEHDGKQVGLSEEQIDNYVKISNKVGMPIAFVEDLAAKRKAYGTAARNDHIVRFDDGAIYIEGTAEEIAKANKENVIFDSLIAHELITHGTENGQGHDQFVGMLRDLENQGVIKGDPAYIDNPDEYNAILAEELILKDVVTLKEIADYNPSVLQYVKDNVSALLGDNTSLKKNSVLSKINNALTGARYREGVIRDGINKLAERRREAQGGGLQAERQTLKDKAIKLEQRDYDLISQAIEANDEVVDDELKDRLVNQFGYDELADASLDDIWDMYVDHQNGQAEAPQTVEEARPENYNDEETIDRYSDDTIAVRKGGNKFVYSPDGRFYGFTVNDVYQSMLQEALEDPTNEKLQEAVADVKKNGAKAKVLQDQGYEVLDSTHGKILSQDDPRYDSVIEQIEALEGTPEEIKRKSLALLRAGNDERVVEKKKQVKAEEEVKAPEAETQAEIVPGVQREAMELKSSGDWEKQSVVEKNTEPKKVVGGKKTAGLTEERRAQLEQERIDKAFPMAQALTELGIDAKTAEEMAMDKVSGRDYMNQEAVAKIMEEKKLNRADATALIRNAMTEQTAEEVQTETPVEEAPKAEEVTEKAATKADTAIKTAEEITGKEYTDEQKETVRGAFEAYERVTEEANRQAFEAYQESQRQFQQKAAEEAQQARAYDRVMAEETQQTQEEAQQGQQTQQETKQEEAPKQEKAKGEDMSPHATVARLLKSKTLSETVRNILKRDYVEKPVKHDSKVFGEAEQLLAESGIEGAVEYANSIQPGSYFGEEAQAYLNEALVRLNAKAVDLETAIGKMDKSDPDYKTLKDLQKTYSEQSVQLLDKLLENASEAGRVVRIMRYLKGNPSLTRTYVEKLVDRLNKQYKDQLNGKTLTVSEDLLNAYANAKTDAERAEIMEKIQYEVADQMPRKASDMIRQWRMTCMLLNPKTHARNIISNGLTYGLFGASDLTQIAIERGLRKANLIKDSDMRAAITSKEMREAAKWLDSRDNYSDEGGQSDKFNLNQGKLAAGAFRNDNPIGKSLNAVSKFNSRLLEAEDTLFVGARAHLALAESLTAQGYSVAKDGDGWKITDKEGDEINEKVLKAMEKEALKNAQEATYHDFNKTAKAIEDFKKNGGIAGKAVDIVVPFTKTPANILRRSIEFSPVGLAKSLSWNLAQVKKGNMSASTAVTQLSRGLTGTAMFALGALLANMGHLSEPEDDESKTEYYKSNIYGKQDLALHIGDKYYSVDWAMPSASPLMMGATMAKTFREHGLNIFDYDLKEVLTKSAEAINPVLEASYLGSLNDFVTSMAQGINYGGELMPAGALGAGERAVESVAENFVGQLTPTVGGALNRTFDSKKRTTSGNTMAERMKNRTLMNLPGGSRALQPAVDQKGQEIENFDFGMGGIGRFIYNTAVPATITTDTHDELDDKLMEAGENAMPLTQTGSGGLKSKISSDKTLKESGIDLKNVSGKDYTQVKKTYYGNYRDYVKDYNELADYNNLGTETRDKVYGKLSNLALAQAKAEIYGKVGDVNDLYTDEQKAALAAEEYGITPAQFFLMKENGLSGNRKALYVMSELENLGVADKVTQDLMDGKYKSSAWGLTDSVVLKTADERETLRDKYLAQDGETLESLAAGNRLNGAKKETDESEETSSLAEAAEAKYIKNSTDKLLESRAMDTGMTKDQYRSYQDIEGIKRDTGGTVSYTQQLKVAEAMMKDGTWDSYRQAYEDGDLNQDDLKKVHLNKTFLGWTDDAIERAIEKMNNGEWVDVSEFKKQYKNSTGRSVTRSGSSSGSRRSSRRSSGSSSSSSSTASSGIDTDDLISLFQKIVKSAPSGKNIKSSVGEFKADDVALWDKIVNSEKSNVEKLRKELKL
jgi:hypothetical protein